MEPTEIIREIKRSNLHPESKHIQPAAIREVLLMLYFSELEFFQFNSSCEKLFTQHGLDNSSFLTSFIKHQE